MEVGLPYTPTTNGYFFTDSQVEDMGRDVLTIQALERKIVALEDLVVALEEKDTWATGYRLELVDSLERAQKLQSSGFWHDVKLGTSWLGIGVALGWGLGVAR